MTAPSKTQPAKDLTERAMLVTLSIRAWSAKRHDKRVSEEVAARHNTSADAGAYNKVLMLSPRLDRLKTITSRARQLHYENTLPWGDWGARLLPSANFIAYTGLIRPLREEYRQAVTEFVAGYEDDLALARERLNGLWNPDDYPKPGRLARRFAFEVDVAPLPDAGDFRVSLGAEETEAIRAGIEAQVKDSVDRAVRDLWSRIYEQVARIQERLSTYTIDPLNGKVTAGIFRDSMVENLRELVALLPRLNVTGDPELAAMTERLSETLCQAQPRALREDAALRTGTLKEAEDILAELAGYVGPEPRGAT
ncbi:MAG: hypothetical protein GC191_08075 [Azospirillum sp.]|nr:hypothetical protein [Azospirillum sp.]